MFKVIKIVGLVMGLLPVAFSATPASADPKEMLIEKDWGAYRYDDSAGRMCFVSSVPKESKGKYDPKTAVKRGCLSHMARTRLNEMSYSLLLAIAISRNLMSQ